MSTSVGVISAGAWGTAVARVLARKGYAVEAWDHVESVVEEINTSHTNNRYLYGVELPANLTANADLERVAEGKDCLFVATPSLYVEQTIGRIARLPSVESGRCRIALLTKGFVAAEPRPLLLTEALERKLPRAYRGRLVYLSGPSHAEEVARETLTGLVSASRSAKNSIWFRELFSDTNLMVFSSLDVVGVQTAAAVKNVVAIAFGMLDALMELSGRFGDNTESLLLAGGLNEIQAIGLALGSTHPETFTSIAGVGDLEVTCRSRYGRNRKFGKEIILDRIIERFRNLDDLIARIETIGYLPEGVVAARFVRQIAEHYGLRLTICSFVYKILNRELDPLEAIQELFRLLRVEGAEELAGARRRPRRAGD